MMKVHIDKLVIDCDPLIQLFKEQSDKLDKIMTTQSEVAAQVAALEQQALKLEADIEAVFAKLEQQAAEASPEMVAAVASAKATLQRLDDRVPERE